MMKRFGTAMVALLVVGGLAFPASAAPLQPRERSGFTQILVKLVDAVIGSLRGEASADTATIGKNANNAANPDPQPDGTRADVYARMAFGLEPNG